MSDLKRNAARRRTEHRLASAAAAGVTAIAASAAVVAGTATPALANTNFNASCESAEACNYRLTGFSASGGIWDFEGTDHDFRNNFYVGGSDLNIDNRGTTFIGRGQSCTAVFSNGYGDPSDDTEFIILPPGFTAFDAAAVDAANGTAFDNSASQLWWSC